MQDYYTELLTKQKMTGSTVLKKIGLIAATVASMFLVFFTPFAIIVPILLIWADIVMFPKMDLEYEYLYINGELDIDKIMAKKTRKTVFETNVNDMIVIAPSGSIELQPYQHVRTHDYSSKVESHKKYELVTTEKGHTIKIIFEPNQIMLDGMKMLVPRKVFF